MQTVAFLGRYGHQPYDVVMRMPITHMLMLAERINDFLEQEHPAEKLND